MSIGPVSNIPAANALTLDGTLTVLTAHNATATSPGVVSTTTQTFAGDKTFNGDVSLQGNLNMVPTTATTGIINVGGTPFIHTFGTNNTFVGVGAGNLTLTGISNTVVGQASGAALTTGIDNSIFGRNTGAVLTTGNNNTLLGQFAANTLTTGTNNIIIGRDAGFNISTNSNNILIGSAGSNLDSGAIRLGGVSQTSAFIAGIGGVAPTGTPQVVFINPATNQLGSLTFVNQVYIVGINTLLLLQLIRKCSRHLQAQSLQQLPT